mmetsp:Transcript_36075/g.52674  ORF Transcript_36075/g.52674 Transcript_36075/m.52674 type:complete len:98 (-) Transcript_36075:2128-2421(-)
MFQQRIYRNETYKDDGNGCSKTRTMTTLEEGIFAFDFKNKSFEFLDYLVQFFVCCTFCDDVGKIPLQNKSWPGHLSIIHDNFSGLFHQRRNITFRMC